MEQLQEKAKELGVNYHRENVGDKLLRWRKNALRFSVTQLVGSAEALTTGWYTPFIWSKTGAFPLTKAVDNLTGRTAEKDYTKDLKNIQKKNERFFYS